MSIKTPFRSVLEQVEITGGRASTSVPTSLKAREAAFYLDSNDSLCIAYAKNSIGSATQSGAGTDDFTTSGAYTGDESNKTLYVEIVTDSTPDTFKLCDIDGVALRENIEITGAFQDLYKGITGKFDATSGHTSGDKWYFTVAEYGSGVLVSGS